MSVYLITCNSICKVASIEPRRNNMLHAEYYPVFNKSYTQGIIMFEYHSEVYRYIPYKHIKEMKEFLINTTVILLVSNYQIDTRWVTKIQFCCRTEHNHISAQNVFDVMSSIFQSL